MKVIKFKLLISEVDEEPIVSNAFTPWSEENEEIVKATAYNGEYTIEDDGQPQPVAEPTTDEILNAMLGVTV